MVKILALNLDKEKIMGLFSKKYSNGMKKSRESFSQKMYRVFSGKALDEDFYDELEEALLTADIGVAGSMNLIENLKDECFQQKIKKTEDAKNLLKQLMVESIDYEIPEYEYPLVLLVSGVNGVGKTTAIGKLANKFKSEGKSVVVAAADTFRAAASEQLEVWGKRAGVRVIRHAEGADPAAVVFDAITSAKAKNTDVLLVDTAGRLHNKVNLMNELKKICRVVERELPEADFRKFLVLDATTGQNAVAQAQVFSEAIELDGIILTKLDGTAKGGVVVAISEDAELPVNYVGVGEQIDDLVDFDATDFINALFE